MSSVNLNFVNTNFRRYDIDGSGGLDRAEIAKASLNAMGQEDVESQTAGQLFATMVLGGKDQLGLFPDDNGDEQIQFEEFQKLAAASGNSTSIESSDFAAAFPDNYNPDGNAITTDSMEQLKQISEVNLSKFSVNGLLEQLLQWLQGGQGSLPQAV